MMKIYSGNYSVFASGIVFSYSMQDGFEFEIEPSKNFRFSLFFKIKEDGGECRLDKTVEKNNNRMNFTCCNFGTGAGTTEPIEIATVENKKMYIHFWLETIGVSKKVYSLKYTIFIERQNNNETK